MVEGIRGSMPLIALKEHFAFPLSWQARDSLLLRVSEETIMNDGTPETRPGREIKSRLR